MSELAVSRMDWFGMGAVAAFLALGAAGVSAQEVTYTRDIAPIIQQNCQQCHMEGSIAPIQLTNYAETRRYARRIRAKVADRIMPPWHIDRTVGIQDFKNDRSLSDEDVAKIVAWVDNGTPEGDPADLPESPDFTDPLGFQLEDEYGAPDMVIESPAYTLEAETQDKWFRPITDTGIEEPRWVRAIEIRPVGADSKTIMHHVLAFLSQDEENSEYSVGPLITSARGGSMGGPGLFMEWAVGKEGEIFPDGAGKLMLPGSQIRWELHMHAMGEIVEDATVELGVWFYDEDNTPENRTRLRMFDARGETGLDIEPNSVAVTQQYHVLRWPTRLENFQPHMHMRGKVMQMEAIYPDGRSEVLSRVDNFQWNWHVNYIYADDAAPLLPAGTTLVITAWHDNTADNPNNPDPTQWIGWGDRTVDEMAHAWVDVTYLSEDQFSAEVARRERMADNEMNENDEGGR
jgi:mono/diheme cytochrome c family protein